MLQTPIWAGDKKETPKEISVDGELINADLKDKVRTQMYCKTYTFKMIEGRNYQLDMRSNVFDSYLRLENPDGVQVAFDDDSGGFPHARIVYRVPKTGDYTIICTTFSAGATGKYNLIVKDLTGGPAPKEKILPRAPEKSSLPNGSRETQLAGANSERVETLAPSLFASKLSSVRERANR
jgi:hypothetical protein